MLIFNKKSDLSAFLSPLIKQNKSIGFVPTMGALHQGHLSLLKNSLSENDVTVMSIFVNPTQFNNAEDLDKYPRTLERDVQIMQDLSNKIIVYAPEVADIYEGNTVSENFNYDGLENQMEGKHRPGHFDGVGTIVKRLFEIVQPNKAYFGEKDWQQIAVVKALVRYLGLKLQIVECDTIREADGLAKSSRNTLLAPDERAIAPSIFKALKASVEFAKTHTVKETHDKVVSDINAVDGLEVEYFQIVDGDSLQDVASWEDSAYVVGCITVYCGKTPIRLIDHIKYKG